jgi:hypothetical protein
MSLIREVNQRGQAHHVAVSTVWYCRHAQI